MAIKDQCTQCVHHRQGICDISSVPPVYNQTSCETYRKTGIDLAKHDDTKELRDENLDSSILTEKQKMFSNPFSFSGRIRRLEYGFSYIIMYLYAISVGIITGAANVNEGTMCLFLIPAYWFIYAQGAKRCHDRDNSGWYQIIPFYGLWMLFADGDAYENSYGPDPKGRNICA